MSGKQPSRRDLLQGLGQVAGAGLLLPLLEPSAAQARIAAAVRGIASRTPQQAAADDEFWKTIAAEWDIARDPANLNYGGCCPAPRAALEKLFEGWRFANGTPYHNLTKIQEPQKAAVREGLARLLGAASDEIALVRNTTEALDAVIFGLPLERGDEVLSTDLDYPRMVNSWRQRVARDGIVYRQIEPELPLTDPAKLVAAFEAAITPRTRALLFPHVINFNGQILPARELCRLARARGLVSIVDGAHSFAHLDFRLDDIGCDVFAASLHKWLCAPVGNGMLYVRRSVIPQIWPLFAPVDPRAADIGKFEQYGTHPVPVSLAIAESIRIHDAIGAARKEARLIAVRERWAAALADLPRVRFLTDRRPGGAGALATFAIDGVDATKLSAHLLEKHRILAQPILHARFQGIRATAHWCTTDGELDRFVAAVTDVARQGLPGS